MIGRIRGTVVEQGVDTLVVDVSGVGYEIHPSFSIRDRALELAPGVPLEVVVHTVVRENDISLFGFSSALEKRVFLLLQRVRGVGAKLALQIVSSMGAEQLLSAIGTASLTDLCRVPGVGKKTAERIIVELREMVAAYLEDSAAEVPRLSQQIEVSSAAEDALLALEKLGFASDRAREAIASAQAELAANSSTETILHAALAKVAA